MLRYCPDRPLPPYSYVPGRFPHPISDPRGHSYRVASGLEEAPGPSLSSASDINSDWRISPDYLFGIDLFNHGFYWEAHETWEQLWIAFGRHGRNADFIKGLIKLAAAGVKAREGRAIGVDRHARRALELFRIVSRSHENDGEAVHIGGIDLDSLCEASAKISQNADSIIRHSGDPLDLVLPLVLEPGVITSQKVI